MAVPYEIPGFTFGTLVAAADLRTAQYCFVVIDGNGKVALPGGTGVVCAGVLQNKPNTGEAATVMMNGITKLKADPTGLTAGDKIEALTTTGTAQVAAGGATNIMGVALQTAGANTYFSALINCATGFIETP
jgi:predicted RecA/RadA family phage recombinase